MAHKTLIGGTAYNVKSGTSMVSGTTYNIANGRTLVGGTGYNINFTLPKTAMLYSDGNFVFQDGDNVAPGKTLTASYTDFEDTTTPPWNGKQNGFKNVSFDTEIAPVSMAYWFNNARNMNTNLNNFSNLKMNNVTNMSYAYHYCNNLTGSPVCGNNVTNMSYAYCRCNNLNGFPVCGNNVIDMSYAYYGCSLTGLAVCGKNVTNMSNAYYGCSLTGSPVCGNNVTNMSYAYYHCRNLTGSPACGNNVTNMSWAYFRCDNMVGSPVCGNNVKDMSCAYQGCSKIKGSPVCGNNVTNMYLTYGSCRNLAGNAYFYSPVVSNAGGCFMNLMGGKRLNIYVVAGSTTNTTVHYSNSLSLAGVNITWTNKGSYQYNSTYNLYIYPVANVAAARAANGD